MELEAITNLVSNVAFPIACCVILFVSNHKQYERYRDDTERLRDTVDRNTQAIQEQKEILISIKERLL